MSERSPTSPSLETRIVDLERQLLALQSPARAPIKRSRSRRIFSGLAVGLVLASMPMLLVASHEPFTDVSDTYLFHQEIGDLYNARIVTGTSATTYSPSLDVQRGQMAAFIHRSIGRTAAEQDFLLSTAEGSAIEVASLTIRSGGVGGGTGFILVTANASLIEVDAANCPCSLGVRPVVNGSAPSLWEFETITDTASPYLGTSFRMGSASISWVVPVTSGATNTVDLLVAVDTTGVGTVNLQGHLAAVYVPLGSTGGSTLSATPTAKGGLNGLPE
jgi:hypothetical protein